MSNPQTGGAQLVAQDGIKLPVALPQTPGGNISLSDRGFFFPLSAANGAFSAKLPNPQNCIGQPLFYKKVDATTNVITLIPFATDLIDGGASIALSAFNQIVVLVSDGVNFNVMIPTSLPTSGIIGSGVANSLALWAASATLASANATQNPVTGQINFPGGISTSQILYTGTAAALPNPDLAVSISILSLQLNDLISRYRLLFKAYYLQIGAGAIANLSPRLLQTDLAQALAQN